MRTPFKEAVSDVVYKTTELLLNEMHPKLFNMYQRAFLIHGGHLLGDNLDTPSIINNSFTWGDARRGGLDCGDLIGGDWHRVHSYVNENWYRARADVESAAINRDTYELL